MVPWRYAGGLPRKMLTNVSEELEVRDPRRGRVITWDHPTFPVGALLSTAQRIAVLQIA